MSLLNKMEQKYRALSQAEIELKLNDTAEAYARAKFSKNDALIRETFDKLTYWKNMLRAESK